MVIGQLDQVDNRGSHESMDIASKIENLENWFDDLQTRIINELTTNPGVTTKELLNKLTRLPLSLRKDYESSITKRMECHGMLTETQINDLFIAHLNPLTSFIDYGLIEYVIRKFGSSTLKRDMRSYCSEMIVFMKETTIIKKLINHLPGQTEIPPKFSLIEAKIGQNASECTLEGLNTLRKRYCSEVKLSEIVFHLVAVVESNAFIVRWLVPSALIDGIVKSTRNVDQSFFQEYKITSLTLDGMWLFLNEAEIDAMWSRLHVSDTKLKDQFHNMCKQIVYEMKLYDVSQDHLSSYFQLLNYQQQNLISHQFSVALLRDEFPASFVDFGVLKAVIEGFGSDCLKRVMRSYCNYYMSNFTEQSTAQQLINIGNMTTIQSTDFKIARCKIMEKPSNYKLEKVFSFRTRFCTIADLSELCFVMDEVNTEMSGSFTVSWLVPPAFVSNIMKSSKKVNHKLYHRFNITSLILDGMWLHLSESEVDAMWSQLHVSDTKLKDRFQIMYKQIVYELRMAQITGHQLSSFFEKSLEYHQSTNYSLSHELLNHRLPVSVVDFRVLAAAIEGFGSDYLKSVMSSYSKYMSTFLKESTAQQLNSLSTIQLQPSGYSIVKCRIKEESSQYKLDKLFEFRTEFCTIADLSELCFVMDEVNTEMSGSFTVSWLVSPAFISKFSRNVDQSFYHRYKITSLTLDGLWLFLNEAEIDAMWSQVHVSDTKFKDQFRTMCKQIVCEMKVQNVSEDHLLSYLQSLKFNYQRQISDQFSLAILKDEFPASFVDFGVLKAVIEGFGSDCLKRVMESYCKYMPIFTNQSTAQQLINLSAFQSEHWKHFVVAKCTIMEEPLHCSLENLLQFRTRFCAIASFNEVCFVMSEINMVKSASFTVSWLVPSDLVSDIIVKCARYVDQSFYQEYKIISLTLDGMWIFLSDAEIDAMWHPSNFESQLLTMYRQIVCEMKAQEISRNVLSSFLMVQHPKLQSNESIQLSEAFLKHDLPLSVLDFRVLSIVIDKFGSDCLKSVMKSFQNYVISIYTRESTVEQLVSLPPIPSQSSKYFVSVESRNREEPSDCRLARLLNFQARFCNIVNVDEVCFILDKIKSETGGSFVIEWHVPSSLALELIMSANQLKQTKIFQEMNVASLQLGGMWLYNYQLTPIGIKLRKRYQQSQGSPSPVEWIPSPTKKIFRLAMIQRERVQRGHIEDRLVRMTISGTRVDDILHAKSPVELEHIFRIPLHGGEIILIEGAPGSGKSTLTVHICQRWGKGELFQQFTVVILVQLGDPAVQRAQTIADLLPVENAQEIAAELIVTNGHGVLLVLDGWDELPPHLQQDSIFRKLIEKMLKVSECSVIVTSRPISSANLHPVISSRIEVLGFTPEEQRQYFTECLKGDTKALEALLEKIQENPVVQSICYLPLNAAFIVHIFKYRDQSLPNTEYEIYSSVILSCIQRHYDREGRGHDLPRELASLDDLSRSEAVREPFQCLCELAYRGVMENKVTFSSSDLPQGSNTLSLLQAIESFLQSGKSVFYTFLHLSIQEVLSAYYITTRLSDSEQMSQFQQLFNQPYFAAVFQFYAVVTKLESDCPGIRKVFDTIVEAKSKPLLVSLLRCLHEARDPALCLYVAERLVYELDLSETSLSPLDCLSISFFLSSIADKKITVNLSQCQIDDLGAKYLTKYLSVSGCTDLVTINLKGNAIHDEGASHIAKMLRFIERLHLDISKNPIGVAGTSYVFQAVRKSATLKTLFLMGGTIIDDLLPVENVKKAQEIATVLRATNRHGVLWILDDPQPRLHTVFLSPKLTSSDSKCSIIVTSRHTIDKIFKDKSKSVLVSLLRCLYDAQDPVLCLYVAERLEYRLDLSRTLANPLDCLFVRFFLSCLSGKETYVDLAYCAIGNTGASFISRAIRETATLKTLILHKCSITSRGTEDIARALAQNRSLEKLDISWNSLGDKGISHVAEALIRNKHCQLNELWIGQCGMTDKGAASLASALTVNNSLKMIHIGGLKGALTEDGLLTIAHSLATKSLFVTLAIPGSTTAFHLSQKINEARKRNGLPTIKIERKYTVCCMDVLLIFCVLYTYIANCG